MSCSKSIIDIDISMLRELTSEEFDFLLCWLELFTILLTRTCLLSIESKVVKKDDFSVLSVGNRLVNVLTDAVSNEGN